MKIKSLLYPVVGKLFQISGKFKRDKELWIFGAWRGQQYSDNCKYMFEYMNQHHKNIRCVWLTKKQAVVKAVRKKGYKAFSQFSLKAVYYALKAGFVFESEGVQDIPYHFLLNGAVTIQLWHGIALKSCSNWLNSGKYVNNGRPWNNHYEQWNWMAASQMYIDTYTDYIFGHIPREKFTITGLPRNDTFINRPQSQFVSNLKKKHPCSKLICYMPTHRSFGEFSSGVLTEENLKKIDIFLRNEDIYLVLKPHFHELKSYMGKESQFTNIIFAVSEEFEDVYEYIHDMDLLISDYSSILCDFICAGKPIILFDYDMEDFIKREGDMLPVYYKFRFGPRCKTWDEVLENVKMLIKNDTWKAKREEDFPMLQKFNDGKNCERVYQAVMNMGQAVGESE